MTNSTNYVNYNSQTPIAAPWLNDVNASTYNNIVNVVQNGAVGDGVQDNSTTIIQSCTQAGQSGALYFPPGAYNISSQSLGNIFSCSALYFAAGAVLVPSPGTSWIIDAAVYSEGNVKIFNTGFIVTGCDCNSGSTSLRSWNYGFQASDVGLPVCFTYGGALIGPAPSGNFVQNRTSFNTTIAAYAADNAVTVSSSPISPIRQDFVIDSSYAFLNTGIVVVGNGTITFTNKVSQVNVTWFGSDSTGRSMNKAAFSFSREFGGSELWFPNGQYNQNISLLIDTPNVTIKSNPRLATLFTNNGTALQRMNSISTVWRGRYGGGGPVISSEDWTWGPGQLWGGDWELMSGFVLDGPVLNGNYQNRPSLTPGTGIDSWDAGLSVLYTARTIITKNCSFENCIRWGAALSTLSDDSQCEDGAYFNACGEGGFYAETSSRITCGAITVINSPVAGWNMGAVTFSSIQGGSISEPQTSGCNNGIYIRNGSSDIDVDVGFQYGALNNAIWVYDETLGSNIVNNISIIGGSVRNSLNGVVAQYVNGLKIEGITGSVTGGGIYVAHCSKFNVESNSVNGTTFDIEIDAGTTYGTVDNNTSNVSLVGTSTAYLSVGISQGYTFTNTSTGTGYLSLLNRTNFGDGNGRHVFGTGGIGLSSNTWNTYPIDMNENVFWIDGSGHFRGKVGYPTSDTDGYPIVDMSNGLFTLSLPNDTALSTPIIASASTIAPTNPIVFVSGTTQIQTITPPAGIVHACQITLIPTGIFTTGTSGNIAIASTSVVNKALVMTYSSATSLWYPSY